MWLHPDLLFLLKIIGCLVGWLLIKTAKEGAQTTIHCAVSEDVKGVTGTALIL